MLQSQDTQDTQLQQKACAKARASSMPVENWCNRIKNITEHSSPLTHAPNSTAHAAYTGPVASRMPCAWPHPTNILKHSHMLQSHDTRDTQLQHKACAKARASSMPVENWCNKIKNIIEHLSPLTHAEKATTHAAYTGPVPSPMPRACPRPTSTLKHSHMLQSYDTRDTQLQHKACTKAHASSMPTEKQL